MNKNMFVYFGPLINYSQHFTSLTPSPYIAFDQLFTVFHTFKRNKNIFKQIHKVTFKKFICHVEGVIGTDK